MYPCVYMCVRMCVFICVFVFVISHLATSCLLPYVQYSYQNLVFLPWPVPCADETRHNKYDKQNSTDTSISNNQGGKRNNTGQIWRITVNIRNSMTYYIGRQKEKKNWLLVKIQSESYSFDIALKLPFDPPVLSERGLNLKYYVCIRKVIYWFLITTRTVRYWTLSVYTYPNQKKKFIKPSLRLFCLLFSPVGVSLTRLQHHINTPRTVCYVRPTLSQHQATPFD
jgi:hypothetical protein